MNLSNTIQWLSNPCRKLALVLLCAGSLLGSQLLAGEQHSHETSVVDGSCAVCVLGDAKPGLNSQPALLQITIWSADPAYSTLEPSPVQALRTPQSIRAPPGKQS